MFQELHRADDRSDANGKEPSALRSSGSWTRGAGQSPMMVPTYIAMQLALSEYLLCCRIREETDSEERAATVAIQELALHQATHPVLLATRYGSA